MSTGDSLISELQNENQRLATFADTVCTGLDVLALQTWSCKIEAILDTDLALMVSSLRKDTIIPLFAATLPQESCDEYLHYCVQHGLGDCTCATMAFMNHFQKESLLGNSECFVVDGVRNNDGETERHFAVVVVVDAVAYFVDPGRFASDSEKFSVAEKILKKKPSKNAKIAEASKMLFLDEVNWTFMSHASDPHNCTVYNKFVGVFADFRTSNLTRLGAWTSGKEKVLTMKRCIRCCTFQLTITMLTDDQFNIAVVQGADNGNSRTMKDRKRMKRTQSFPRDAFEENLRYFCAFRFVSHTFEQLVSTEERVILQHLLKTEDALLFHLLRTIICEWKT
jgi:hypothetical protein